MVSVVGVGGLTSSFGGVLAFVRGTELSRLSIGFSFCGVGGLASSSGGGVVTVVRGAEVGRLSFDSSFCGVGGLTSSG